MLRFIPRQARPLDGRAAAALRPYEGVTARLLYARGITDAQQADAFLNPSLERLHDPLRMHGMAEALAILTDARQSRLPVVVYGDYDVDGICACALMTQALRRFGLRADPYTPLREAGYGLNLSAVEQLARDYRVLVTVDLGITNHEEVRMARRLGMRVIVTDHHGLGLEASPADAALNPLLGDYPFRRLCGTGVAFKLAQALLGLEACREYLDLAALATVADIVPLEDENRILVALGLKTIAGRKRQGMRALLRVSGDPDPVDSDVLGYRLGPRLNAAGRLDDAGKGVRLMMTDDPAEADRLAEELDALNTARRAAEQRLVKAAQAQAAAHDFIGERALIVRGQDWHVGVIGLAAGRLCQQYYCPTCVLSEHDGLLHGSLRSIPGVHIHECLKTCDDLLLRYGGHEQAAGVTLEADRYEAVYTFYAMPDLAGTQRAPLEASGVNPVAQRRRNTWIRGLNRCLRHGRSGRARSRIASCSHRWAERTCLGGWRRTTSTRWAHASSWKSPRTTSVSFCRDASRSITPCSANGFIRIRRCTATSRNGRRSSIRRGRSCSCSLPPALAVPLP